MKAFGIPVLLCCMGLVGCKTSHFRSQTPEGVTTAVEEATPEVPPLPVVPEVTEIKNTAIETSTSTLQLNQTCDKPVQLLSSVVKVSFRSIGNCEFGVAPNLLGAGSGRECLRVNKILAVQCAWPIYRLPALTVPSSSETMCSGSMLTP